MVFRITRASLATASVVALACALRPEAVQAQTLANLGVINGGNTVANAMSSDGSLVEGNWYADNFGPGGLGGDGQFYWTQGAGTVPCGGGSPTVCPAIGTPATTSSNGGVATVGSTSYNGSTYAARTTAGTGTQIIQAILVANNVDLGGLTLANAIAVSSDGTIITGVGPRGNLYDGPSWVTEIPVNAFALLDLNGTNDSLGSLLLGGTVVNNGTSAATLTVGSDNTSTTFSGTIHDGSQVTALTKVGSGTLTLNGLQSVYALTNSNVSIYTASSYSGATTISQGTLAAGATNVFSPKSAFAVGSGATLDLGGYSQIIASLSGAGDVTNSGATAATLSLGANNASTVFSGIIANGAAATALTKTGSGTLTLSGANTYTGATLVSAGTLQVNSSIASSHVTVASGANLQGSGTVGALTMNGTLSPGSGTGSIATLSVAGNAALASSATYKVDVGSTTADKLAVTGALSLDGTADIDFATTPQRGESAVIGTASSISGAFASVTDNIQGFLYPVITVVNGSGVQELVVTIDLRSFAGELTNPTRDETVVATALDKAATAHYDDLKDFYDALGALAPADLAPAIDALVPNTARALPALSQFQSDAVSGALWDHLGGLSGDAEPNSWASGSAAPGHVKPAQSQSMPMLGGRAQIYLTGSSLGGSLETGGAGPRASLNGYLVGGGIDFDATRNLTVGAFLAYSNVSSKIPGQYDSTKSRVFQGTAYARYEIDHWFLNAFAGAGTQNVSTDRTVTVGASTWQLHGKTNGTEPTAGAAFGYDWVQQGFTLRPLVGIEWLKGALDGYTEHGGTPAMIYSGLSRSSLTGRAGFDARVSFRLGAVTIQPLADAFVVHDFADHSGQLSAAFTGAPEIVFTLPYAERSDTWLDFGLGAEVALGNNISFLARYDTTRNRSDISYHAWTGALTVRF